MSSSSNRSRASVRALFLVGAVSPIACYSSPNAGVSIPRSAHAAVDPSSQAIDRDTFGEYQGCEPHYRSTKETEVYLKFDPNIEVIVNGEDKKEAQTTLQLRLDHAKYFRNYDDTADVEAVPGSWEIRLKYGVQGGRLQLITATLYGPIGASPNATYLKFTNAFSDEYDLGERTHRFVVDELTQSVSASKKRLIGMTISTLGNVAQIHFRGRGM